MMVVYGSRKIHYSGHLEKEIGELLVAKGIDFIHESEDKEQELDFYLPQHDVYIEVKQFHADRISQQMKTKDNVIAIQGKESIEFIKSIL